VKRQSWEPPVLHGAVTELADTLGLHVRPRHPPRRGALMPGVMNMHMPTSTAFCGWSRPAAALASAVLVAACTASTGMSASRSHPAVQQEVAAAYACGLASLRERDAPDGKLVLGVFSIPDAYWPTVRVHQGPWRYWDKDGLDIRAGHQAVTITVPEAWRARAAITWGNNVGIVSTLRLPGCASGPGTWNGYVGGFYLRSRSACVPLVIGVGRRSAVVWVGVGRRCGTDA